MPSVVSSGVLQHSSPHQEYPPSPPSSQPHLHTSLISARPILPLPKRRVPSNNSNGSTTSTTTPTSSSTPFTAPQIFHHTYPATNHSTNSHNPRYISLPSTSNSYDSSDSEDDDNDAGSSSSSLGREDFNLQNKKKRKIPLSASMNSGNVGVGEVSGSLSVGNGVSSRSGYTSYAGYGMYAKGRWSGWRVPSATLRSEGGYFRRKPRVTSSSSSTTTAVTSKGYEQDSANGEYVNGLVDSENKETGDDVEKEESKDGISGDTEPTTPPPSGPFSFTFSSPLTVPINPPIPPIPPPIGHLPTYVTPPSAPPTVPLPVPPPPPPPQTVQGQENLPPQQPYPAATPSSTQPQSQVPAQQQPQQQQPQQQRPLQQGIKHPNSEKARRVAQLTKLRERYRTGPKPETDEIYICPFCTYGFIYGEDPIYLIRQYNRKRNAEIRLRRERRKMLEKARMKGKKGQSASNNGNQNVQGATSANGEEFEDDGVCCTCGQQVGQHNHSTPTPAANATVVDGGGGVK